MKAKELIERLQEFDPEIDVVVYADHGQTPMSVYKVSYDFVEDDEEYMMEFSEKGTKVIVIEG